MQPSKRSRRAEPIPVTSACGWFPPAWERRGVGVSRVNSEFLRTRLRLPASAAPKTSCCAFSLRCLPICLSLFILLGEKFWPQALPHHHTKKQKASGWPLGRRWPLQARGARSPRARLGGRRPRDARCPGRCDARLPARFGEAVAWVPRPAGGRASQSPWAPWPQCGLAPRPRRVLTLLGRDQRQRRAHR